MDNRDALLKRLSPEALAVFGDCPMQVVETEHLEAIELAQRAKKMGLELCGETGDDRSQLHADHANPAKLVATPTGTESEQGDGDDIATGQALNMPRREFDEVAPSPDAAPAPKSPPAEAVGEVPAGTFAAAEELPDYPSHSAAQLFPMMDPRELKTLATDIKEHGLGEAIVLYEGAVLDGRNRQAACKIAQVSPTYKEWGGDGSAVSFVVSRNLHRRHMTRPQRAMAAAKAKEELAKEARARSAANLKQNGRTTDGLDPGHRDFGRSSQKAAQAFKVSKDAVEKSSRVIKRGVQELADAVTAGEVSLDAAAMVADLPKHQQREQVKAGTVKESAKAIRKAKRRKRAGSAATEDAPAPYNDPSQSTRGPSDPRSPGLAKPVAGRCEWREALSVVSRGVRSDVNSGRVAVLRIGMEAKLEVWAASDNPAEDIAELAKLLVEQLQAHPASDAPRDTSREQTCLRALYDILEAQMDRKDRDGAEVLRKGRMGLEL